MKIQDRSLKALSQKSKMQHQSPLYKPTGGIDIYAELLQYKLNNRSSNENVPKPYIVNAYGEIIPRHFWGAGKLKDAGKWVWNEAVEPVWNKVSPVLDFGSDMGTGAFTKGFSRPVYDDQGKLQADFSWGSVGSGLLDLNKRLGIGLTGGLAYVPLKIGEKAGLPSWMTSESFNDSNARRWVLAKQREKGLPDDYIQNPFESGRDQRNLGRNQYWESNLPMGAKVAGSILFDPTTYVTPGAVGKASAKLGIAGTRVGKTLFGGEKILEGAKAGERAKATSRTARIAGGLFEGFNSPKEALVAAGTAGLSSELSSRTSNKWDDTILGFAAPMVGAGGYNFASSKITTSRANMIADKNGAVFKLPSKTLEDALANNKAPVTQSAQSWGNTLDKIGINKWERKFSGIDDYIDSVIKDPKRGPNAKITAEELKQNMLENQLNIEETVIANPRFGGYMQTESKFQKPYFNLKLSDFKRSVSEEMWDTDGSVRKYTTYTHKDDPSLKITYMGPNLRYTDTSKMNYGGEERWFFDGDRTVHNIYADAKTADDFFYNLNNELNIANVPMPVNYRELVLQQTGGRHFVGDSVKITPDSFLRDNWLDHEPKYGVDNEGYRTTDISYGYHNTELGASLYNEQHIKRDPQSGEIVSQQSTWRFSKYGTPSGSFDSLDEAVNNYNNYINTEMNKGWGQSPHFHTDNTIAHVRTSDLDNGDTLYVGEIQSEFFQGIDDKFQKQQYPFSENWQDLIIKRLIRYAADNGYSAIRFSTGERSLDAKGLDPLEFDKRKGRIISYDNIKRKAEAIAKSNNFGIETSYPSGANNAFKNALLKDNLYDYFKDEGSKEFNKNYKSPARENYINKLLKLAESRVDSASVKPEERNKKLNNEVKKILEDAFYSKRIDSTFSNGNNNPYAPIPSASELDKLKQIKQWYPILDWLTEKGMATPTKGLEDEGLTLRLTPESVKKVLETEQSMRLTGDNAPRAATSARGVAEGILNEAEAEITNTARALKGVKNNPQTMAAQMIERVRLARKAERDARFSTLFGSQQPPTANISELEMAMSNTAKQANKPVSAMTQAEYAKHLETAGLPEGVMMPYSALTTRPEFRNLSSQQRNAIYDQNKQAAKDYATGAEQLWRKLRNRETKIEGIEASGDENRRGGWENFKINTDKGGATRHKAYATISDFVNINHNELESFMVALRDEGFNGQLKFPADGNRALIGFDNIVMHGATKEDALLAEQLAKQYFGDRASSTQLGFDDKGKSHTQLMADQLEEALRARASNEEITPGDISGAFGGAVRPPEGFEPPTGRGAAGGEPPIEPPTGRGMEFPEDSDEAFNANLDAIDGPQSSSAFRTSSGATATPRPARKDAMGRPMPNESFTPPRDRLRPNVTRGSVAVESPRTIEEMITEQKISQKSDKAVTRAVNYLIAKTKINPSLLYNSPIQQASIAYVRQRERINQLIGTAVSTLDSFAGGAGVRPTVGRVGGVGGTVFTVDDRGIIRNMQSVRGKPLGEVHWNDVISNPKAYKLTDTQKAYVQQYKELLVGINMIRAENDLPEFSYFQKDGKMWVPRAVKSVDGFEIIKPTNHKLNRVWEAATEGAQNGVQYADPKETMELFLRETYKDISDAQFYRAIADRSVSTDVFVSKKTKGIFNSKKEAFKTASQKLAEAKRALRADPENADLQVIHDTMLADFNKKKDSLRVARERFNNEKKKFQDDPKLSVPGGVFGSEAERVAVKTWRGRGASLVAGGDTRVLPKEEADMLVKILTGEEQPGGFIVRRQENIANISRQLSASTDFAAPFTQLLPMLFTNPAGWAKATALHYYAFLDPNTKARFIRNNIEVLNEMSKYGANPLTGEGWEASAKGGEIPSIYNATVGRIPIVGEAGRAVGKQTYGRFEAAYETALLVSRVEMWKAGRADYARTGNLDGLAQLVRNATGGLNAKELGVTRRQTQVESLWLAFSPKLLRSTVGLFGMAIGGDWRFQKDAGAKFGYAPKNQEAWAARRMLTRMATMGATAYAVAVAVKGQQEGKSQEEIVKEIQVGLNPTSGKKFMAMRIGNGYYGIGGQQRSILQLLGTSTKAFANEDYSVFTDPDMRDNPILSWYSGRGAPGLNFATVTAEAGAKALGGEVDVNPYVEINGPADYLTEMGQSFIPFGLTSYLEGYKAGDMADEIGVTTLGAAGLRTSFISKSEMRDDRVKASDYKDENGNKVETFNALNKNQKDDFFEKYPAEKSDSKDGFSMMMSEYQKIDEDYIKEAKEWQQMVDAGVKTRKEFADWNKTRLAQKYAAQDQVREHFKTVPANRSRFKGSVTDYIDQKKLTPSDQAVSDYYKLTEKFKLPGGQIDFDGLELAREDFKNKLPYNIKAYVEKNTKAKESEVGLVNDLNHAKEIIKPYFNAKDDVFNRSRMSSRFLSQFSSSSQVDDFIAQKSNELGITPDALISVLEKKYPDFKKYNAAITEYRRVMRLRNPELDIALATWYGYSPANKQGYAIYMQTGSMRGYRNSNAIIANKKLNASKTSTALALKLNRDNLSLSSLRNTPIQ